MSKLINGDAIEILKGYADETFDLICTDPPYRIATGGCRIENVGNMTGGILRKVAVNDRLKQKWVKQSDDEDNQILVNTGKLFANNDIKFSDWLPEIYRVLKPNCHTYLMINSRNLKDLWIEAEKVGFKYQNLLVWVKNNVTPNKFYMKSTELILMLRKGKERYINNLGTKNVFTYPNRSGDKWHPTEKPIDLMQDLIINSTNEGDLVLDPFMGSGTTCVACKQTGREYVGIEIEKKYYDIAVKRCENEFVSRGKSEQQLKMKGVHIC